MNARQRRVLRAESRAIGAELAAGLSIHALRALQDALRQEQSQYRLGSGCPTWECAYYDDNPGTLLAHNRCSRVLSNAAEKFPSL